MLKKQRNYGLDTLLGGMPWAANYGGENRREKKSRNVVRCKRTKVIQMDERGSPGSSEMENV